MANTTAESGQGKLVDTTLRRARPSGWGILLAVLLILELLFFSLTNRSFFGGGFGMLSQINLFIPTALVAMGLAMVVLTGRIDLSVGATASLSSVLVGRLLLSTGNIGLSIAVAIGVGLLIGLLNGLMVTYLKLDSLLVTLAMQFVIASVAQAVAGTNPPQGFPAAFQGIGRGTLGGVSSPLVLFLVVGFVVVVVIAQTRFGRSVVLIGHNESAARYSGIPVRRTLIGVFVGSAVIAALGGVLLSAYFNAGRPQAGMSVLLPALTVVVLGGIDIFGGGGRIGDVIIAALLLGYLVQGLLNSGVSSLTATMTMGVVLVVVLIVKSLSEGESVGRIFRRFNKRFRAFGRRPPSPTE